MKKILVFDNYDSFTYNVVNAVRELGYECDVVRNDKVNLEDIAAYNKIIISPGPGIPSEAGMLPKLLLAYGATKSILGICLGEQAIGECFGARLRNLTNVYHGISTSINIIGDDVLFKGLPSRINVGRYHSWIVDHEAFPECLEITATDDNGEIMALRHRTYDVRGVQFHPESILTPDGLQIIKNWIEE